MTQASKAGDRNQAPGKRDAFAGRHSMTSTSGECGEEKQGNKKGWFITICFEMEGHVGQMFFGSDCFI